MNKKLKSLIVLSMIVICALGMVGCSFNKTAITAETFTLKAEEINLQVDDITKDFEGDENIKNVVYIGKSEDDKFYQIEFYELNNNTAANIMFNENKEIFEDGKGSVSSESSVAMGNYAKYALSSDGEFVILSKIDNTFIFAIGSDKYKDDINTFLKNIGY